ncbi:MAG: cupredoxin domain-containing protein [Nitrospirales bacterium]|nr:cupredoxin domain-containing protein [Nitrospirales bacterium]
MELANNSSCSFRAGIVNRYNAFIMMFPLPSFRVFQTWVLMLCLTMFVPPDLAVVRGATPVNLAPAADTEETVVTINIKSREFSPNTLSVTVGQKTRLVLKNLDTELHAFLPVGLLTDIHLNVSGSGAPQFSKEGLSRVLLPTRGQTDIVFIPSHPGTFPYFCDLPGHVMQGTIVVHKNESMVD